MKRRDFLKTLGLGAAGLVISGCGIKNPLSPSGSGQSGSGKDPQFNGKVEYRTIPHGDIKISTIGIGASALHEASAAEIERMISYAAEQGVNLLDTVMSNFSPAEAVAKGLKGRRDKFLTQMHIGVIYPRGTYTRTRDLTEVQDGFEQQLNTFGTDYSDIGMIHYVDEQADYDAVLNNGLLDYAQKLKRDGTIRLIGFSSHSVDISMKFLATGLIDLFMFSTNPAYDFTTANGKLTIADERKRLYEEAQRRGAAITVMKAYSGGKLLSDSSSPFGKAMTPAQCIQYCLDRPAIVSCIPGMRGLDDLGAALQYYTASKEERDYSFIFNTQRQDMDGVCIYCDHCQPCPCNIDIAAVNKYYDLAKSGDGLAKDHYYKLEHTADSCIQCGACEPRCPFHVKIMERMRQTKEYFGH